MTAELKAWQSITTETQSLLISMRLTFPAKDLQFKFDSSVFVCLIVFPLKIWGLNLKIKAKSAF